MKATPTYVQLSSGAGQSATTGTALAQPIQVLVSDSFANPVSGATVTWSITGAGGTFTPSVTNSLGVASTTLTMGTTPGTYNVTATAGAITSADFIQETASPALNQLTNLLFQTQPTSRAQRGIAFPAQPVLFLSNGSSAAYTTPTTVTVAAFKNSVCSLPAIGILNGTLSVQSNSSGVATFTDLVYSTNDVIFLKFSAGSLSSCSNLINIVSPTTSSTKLTLNFTPTSAYIGIQFNFLVNVSDASGNIVGSATNLVSIAPFTDAACTTAATGTLTGNSPVNAYQGQALFNSLNYSKVDSLYFLATSPGLTSVCSSLVNIQNFFAKQNIPVTLHLAALGDSISQAADANLVINIFNLSNLLSANPQYSWSTGNSLANSIYSYLNQAVTNLLLPKYNSVQTNNQSVIGATAENSTIDLAMQVQILQNQNSQVVTLEIGPNDVCSGAFNQTNFANSVQSAVNTLAASSNPPKAIIINSIPNISQLLTLSNSQSYCAAVLPQMCSLVGTSQGIAQLPVLIAQANYSLSQIQGQGTTQVFYDNGAINSVVFSAQDISQDCFHPSISGQNLFAQTVWGAVGSAVLNSLK